MTLRQALAIPAGALAGMLTGIVLVTLFVLAILIAQGTGAKDWARADVLLTRQPYVALSFALIALGFVAGGFVTGLIARAQERRLALAAGLLLIVGNAVLQGGSTPLRDFLEALAVLALMAAGAALARRRRLRRAARAAADQLAAF